jgi:diketogulonate reductase-like aldo/keto reductase
VAQWPVAQASDRTERRGPERGGPWRERWTLDRRCTYRRLVIPRPFGPVQRQVPAIGQGTWHLESDTAAAAIAALQRGLDLGMTHIDTAELYGSGKVEALVGRAIAGRRDEVYLVSKVMPSNASFEGTLRACERSLRHLGTDRLDCYLLHWPGQHPLGDTFAAFEQLVEQGKILSFGVSNFDEDELGEAIEVAGPGRIAQNQVLYNLTERGIEHAVLPLCEANGIAVVGYTPFGTSSFPPRSAGGQRLNEIAARRRMTARQVALAFLTRRPSLFAIPKSSDARHTEENAGAGALQLDDSEIEAIEAAFPLGRRRRGVAML